MLAEEGPQEHYIPVTKWLAISFAREENESWSKGASIPLKHRKARSEGRAVKMSTESRPVEAGEEKAPRECSGWECLAGPVKAHRGRGRPRPGTVGLCKGV